MVTGGKGVSVFFWCSRIALSPAPFSTNTVFYPDAVKIPVISGATFDLRNTRVVAAFNKEK